MFEQSKVDPDDVASVTIGTTVRGSPFCSKPSTRDHNRQLPEQLLVRRRAVLDNPARASNSDLQNGLSA